MEPYEDSLEHLQDELDRLDLLLRRRLEEWWNEYGRSAAEFRGLYVSDEEVDALLSVPVPGRSGSGGGIGDETRGRYSDRRGNHRDGAENHRDGAESDGALARAIEERSREIRNRKRATRATDTPLRLVRLAERFGLDRRHVDALLVAMAPELERKYEKVYGYLQDDITRSRPTVELVFDVLYRSEAERLAARSILGRASPLVRNRLLRIVDGENAPFPSRVVSVDERVVAFLLGSDDPADEIAHLATVVTPEASIDDLLVDDETAERIERAYQRPSRRRVDGSGAETESDHRTETESDHRTGNEPDHRMTYVHGPAGVGKAAVVEALAATGESPLVRVDAVPLAASDLRETVRLLAREATLQGGGLHVEGLARLPEDGDVDSKALVRALDDFEGPVFVTGETPLSKQPPGGVENHTFATIALPVPSYELRRERWAGIEELPSDVDPAALAATFRLTDGQIEDAVRAAAAFSEGERLDPEAVYLGCRSQSSAELGSLARRIDPHYTWEDIVLPPETMAQLRDVAAHVVQQGRVYAEWGFAEKFSHGNGLVVLFTGPSGTGKTMAADIVAGDAGLDLYKIDLANVVSKYIGETEKNLGRIFDEAEDSNAILLFDEADALFGERSEVSDAHDRYANIEVNYLLQRVEEYDGTVILTTNFEGNIDDAFRRRIHVSIDFPAPDREAREQIWRTVFPERTPVGDLDFDFLSSFEITGGNIKNIALIASFLAAEEDGVVEMDHVVKSTEREFRKMGKLVSTSDLGEYDGVVR